MTTVTLLRTTYLNQYLGVASDGDTLPFTTAMRDRAIGDALIQMWPQLGRFVTATQAVDGNTEVYTIPSPMVRVSRIELQRTSGGVTEMLGRVTDWRMHGTTQVWIRPRFVSNTSLVMRFYGWVPFLADASDLPTTLEPAIAMRAAGMLFGAMAGQLTNYQRQQGLDPGRVVDYQTAVGMSAYWERRYFEAIKEHEAVVNYASRLRRTTTG